MMKINAIRNMLKSIKESNAVNKFGFVPYARVLGMFFVILVHLLQQSSHGMWKAAAQFFIVGVMVFIVVSGYCFGQKASDDDYLVRVSVWLRQRVTKILIPYYVFVTFMIIVHFIKAKQVNLYIPLMMFFCVQDFCGDFFYKIEGLGHLWYITMLVLCYLITPILFKVRKTLKNRKMGVTVIFLGAIHILLTMNVYYKLGRYFFYLVVYVVAFWAGLNDKIVEKCQKNSFWKLTILMLVFWGVRIWALFRNVFVYYVQLVFAVWIIVLLANVERFIFNKKIEGIIYRLSQISYFVYLVHYIWVAGPFRIIGCFQNLFFEGVLVVIASLIGGYILYVICQRLTKRVEKK